MTKVYACYNKSDSIRNRSSSGGIFYLLASYVLNQNGVVYGAAFDENYNVYHKAITSEELLDEIMRSKYVQSDIGKTYQEAQEYAKNGRKVLFAGTPCQIAGLKALVGANENIITVDFICHGTPNRIAWSKYLSAISNGEKVKSVNFRDKSKGWGEYSIKIECSNRTHLKSKYDDPYLRAFTSDLILRKSCYSCQHRGIDRKSDITIADFWGVKASHPNVYKKDGTSAVITHSRIGELLFEEIKNNIVYEESDIEIVKKNNSSIVTSPKVNEKRDEFMAKLEKTDEANEVLKLFEEYTKVSMLTRIKSVLASKLRSVLRRIKII